MLTQLLALLNTPAGGAVVALLVAYLHTHGNRFPLLAGLLDKLLGSGTGPASPLVLPTDPAHPFLTAIRRLILEALAARQPVVLDPNAPKVEVGEGGKLIVTVPK